MRKNGVLTYLHSDHLGSTVLETNVLGAITADEKYRAYGKQRDTGAVGTDHRFTGQKEDGSGLQYFNARFYDPLIGMFVSPDTIVPDAGNVFDYNRFMYVRGNPLRFVDPSGHDPCDNGGQNCQESAPLTPSSEIPLEVAQYLYYHFTHLNTPDGYSWEMFYSDLQNAVTLAGGYNEQTYMQVVHNMANILTGNFGSDSALTEGMLLQVILPNDMLGAAVAQEHDQRVGEFAAAASSMMALTYVPSPKHERGGWGTKMDLSTDVAQTVLEQGIKAPNGKQRYGYYNGKLYEFMPDNAGGYHGYPVPGNQVPTDVLRTMREQGMVTNAQYNRFVQGK